MAERRMFSKTIIDSDMFLDMPTSARLLYYDLSMRADDDGFVNAPKKIIRITGASEDDLKILVAKQFIIPFETGIVVIKHWKIHNYIAKDRYRPTQYQDEKNELQLNNDNSYERVYTECIQNVYNPSTQVRIGKDSIGKDSIDKNSIEEDSNNVTHLLPDCYSDDVATDVQKVIHFYNNNLGQLTPYQLTLLQSYIDDMGADLVILAMQKATEAGKRNISYVKGILDNWDKKGIKTIIEAQKEEEEFKKNKTPKYETEEESRKRHMEEMKKAILGE